MYCQVDGLAMGATLAVILAIIRMQSFEGEVKDENDGIMQLTEKSSEKRPKRSKKIVWSSEGVDYCLKRSKKIVWSSECVNFDKYESWFHAKCQNISNDGYQKKKYEK